MRKQSKIVIPLLLLTIWYSLIFWDPARFTVGESPGIFSIYGLLMAFLLISLGVKLFKWKYADHFSALYLTAWTILQWQAHWQAFFFGAGQQKIAGYNSYFSGTYRLSEASTDHLIPDLYHTVLGILLVITLFATLFNVITIIKKNLLKR